MCSVENRTEQVRVTMKTNEVALQLTFGLKPWLPKVIANRSMRREDFESIVGRIHRWLAWAERMLKPRLAIFAEPPAEYLAGAACLLLSIVLLLPVPLGNILPAITISVFAFGILGRDGLFALIGFVMTAVSLFIAGIGLFALVAFVSEQRKKEIGIRKVMGASVSNIVVMINREFIILVTIALLIATPLAWYLANQWLENFAYHAALSWWIFALAGAITLTIAIASTAYQSFKASIANPVDSIRAD